MSFLRRPGRIARHPNRPLLPVFGYLGPQPLYPYMQPIIVVQVPREALNRRASRRLSPACRPACAIRRGNAGTPQDLLHDSGLLRRRSPARARVARSRLQYFPPSRRSAVVTGAPPLTWAANVMPSPQHASCPMGRRLPTRCERRPKPAAPRIALIHSLALDRSIWDGCRRTARGGRRRPRLRLPRPWPLRSPCARVHGRTVCARPRRAARPRRMAAGDDRRLLDGGLRGVGVWRALSAAHQRRWGSSTRRRGTVRKRRQPSRSARMPRAPRAWRRSSTFSRPAGSPTSSARSTPRS